MDSSSKVVSDLPVASLGPRIIGKKCHGLTGNSAFATNGKEASIVNRPGKIRSIPFVHGDGLFFFIRRYTQESLGCTETSPSPPNLPGSPRQVVQYCNLFIYLCYNYQAINKQLIIATSYNSGANNLPEYSMHSIWKGGTLGNTAAVVSSTALALFLAAFVKNLFQLQCRQEGENKKQWLRYHGNSKRLLLGRIIGRVSEINIFPGKSMAACPVKKCQVSNAGLQGDRLIMVVKVSKFSKVVATQRMLPQLSQIKATVDEANTGVTLSLPGSPSFEGSCYLDLTKVDNISEASAVVIDLHTIKARCVDLGDEAATWITNALTKLCEGSATTIPKTGYRIFTLAPKELRKVYHSPAGLLIEDARTFDATLLSDLAPITFTSEASLLALNQVATKAVPMDRFRTNIVANIDDPDLAFLEDHVQTLQIGSHMIFRSMGPTFRCVIPSVDQATGEAGFRKNLRQAEPIATLKRLRSGGLRFGLSGLLPTRSGGSKSLAPLFGIYLGVDHADSSGEVAVGDPIRILEFKSEPGLVAQLIDAVAITLGMGRTV